jgi:hypothetical protein
MRSDISKRRTRTTRRAWPTNPTGKAKLKGNERKRLPRVSKPVWSALEIFFGTRPKVESTAAVSANQSCAVLRLAADRRPKPSQAHVRWHTVAEQIILLLAGIVMRCHCHVAFTHPTKAIESDIVDAVPTEK